MAGFAAEIDLSKLDKMINKLETNLQRFVDKSKDAQTQVVDAFTKMGSHGVDKFVNQLSGAINQVMEIGKKGSAIKWDTQNLNRYIDQVNQLIALVQQFKGAGYALPTDNLNKDFVNISKLKDDIKMINELLTKGEKDPTTGAYRALTKDEQNYYVEQKKIAQEQLKFQQQSIQERLNSVKKALQEELKETQETEKKKTQSRNQSYKGAIKYSDKANSLEQERKAIKNLEAARESLKKTDADYSAKLEELNRRINTHRINVEAATKTEAQRNALTSSTRAEYARLLAEQDKLRQSYDKLKQSQATLGSTKESTEALQNIVKRYRDVYAEILRYKQSANGQLDATERKFLADQAAAFAENEKRKTDIAQQEANKRATISSAEAKKVITSASGAKNVNQQIAAIQQLKDARDKLDKTDKDYKKTLEELNKAIKKHQEEIDKARGKTDLANGSHRKLMDTAGQLQRKLALVFSVSSIQGYISKLMQVRGEFEMQQRSLQVLLQDKDEANKLWDKTVALAVKSPFRVKDLVTYTKQLAAYRVESDKLYETNKMLADVSAGLGVDMNRLILAFGQVKAANYLRGTELRQFSEAGVNMLGELADYFTEIEGRAVSVGDVFERVSKRMVTFEHVNTIFQKITSEGGIFYKMQEKQSETLQGMIMNFRDSMDLMLNDIGKSSDSTLKGAIKLAKEFVDNWRKAEPVIKSVAYSFLAAFSIQQLSKVGKVMTALGNSIKKHPYVAILSVISAIVIACYQWANAQSKVNAALKEVEDEGLKSMQESISLYHELVDTINDVTKSHEERNKALSMLKTKLQDILPDEYLELEYIQKIKGSYKEAEEAMFAYYTAKVKAQKEDKIRTSYAEDINTDTGDLISAFTNQIKEAKNWNDRVKEIMLSGIAGAVNSTIAEVESGKVKPENILQRISERMDKYGGEWFATYNAKTFSESLEGMMRTDNWSKISTNVNQLAMSFKEMQSALKGLQGLSTETYDEYLAGEEINRETKNVEKAVELFKKAASKYEEYVRVIPTLTKDIATQRNEIEEDIQGLLENTPKEFEAYIPLLKDIFAQMKKEAEKGEFDLKAAIQSIQQSLYAIKDSEGNLIGGLAKIARDNINITEEWKQSGIAFVDNFQEGIKEKADKLDMTPMQKAVIKGARGIANKFGVDLDLFKNFIPSSQDALSNVSKNLESYIKDWEERIAKFKSSGAVEDFGVLAPDILTERESEIKEMENALPALREFAKLLGVIFKTKKTKHDNLIEERIKVVDQMNKKYQELNRTLGRTESLQGAFDAYKDAFASAYGRSDVKKMSAEEFASKVLNFPNENDVVKWFDDLAKKTKNVEDKLKVELKKGEYVYDMKVRVEAESDKALLDKIEEMFSGYEMSIELDKLNIPPDLAKQLFNVDSLTLPELKSSIFDEYAKNAKISTSKLIEEFNKANETGKFESLYAILGKDMTEKLKDSLKEIQDLEDKQQVERLKKYTKYLLKAQSERVKIKMDEIRQLKEIEDTFELKENVAKSETLGMTNSQWDAYSKIAKANEEINEDKLKSIGLTDEQIKKVLEYNKAMEKSKQLAIEGVQKETKEKTDKQTWEDFKGTEEYIRLFEDLNSASMSSLTSMKKRLDDMRTSLDDLPPEQLKEIVRLMEQLDEQRIKVNPFKTISEGISELKEARKDLEKLKQDMSKEVGIDNFETLRERASKAKDEYELQQAIYKAKQEGKVVAGQEITIGKQTVKVTNDSLEAEEGKLTKLKESNDELQKFLESYYKITGQQDKAENKIAKTFGSLGDMFSNIAGSVDSLSQSFKTLNIGGQDLQDTMASISQGLSGVANIAQGAMGLMSGNPFEMISGGIQALSGLGEIIGSFIGDGDKKKERQIQREIELVEDLERRYQKLAKAIDNAYALNTLQKSGQQAKSNINQQISAYERMIQAERDKKDTDDARIKEWQQAIEDLREQKAELDKEIVGTAIGGILDDVLSAAQDFTNAWLDAFNETGDGLDGLSRNFKGTMLEMVKQQAAMLISQAYIDKWKHQLSQYINPDDLELTTDEARRWIDSVTSSLPQLNEALERYFLAMKEAGVDLTGGNSELSGLQRGIQGITEQQADILAAYLNSIRFFVSDNNTYLSRIAESLGNTEIENPMVGQLRIIASQTTAINELLNSLVAPHPTLSGRGLKVII